MVQALRDVQNAQSHLTLLDDNIIADCVVQLCVMIAVVFCRCLKPVGTFILTFQTNDMHD